MDAGETMPFLTTAIRISIALLLALTACSGGTATQVATFGTPTTEEAYAVDGAELTRRADGLNIVAQLPTPVAGSYEYPTGDMVPPWAEPHPAVTPGNGTEPEAFTLWVIVFNYPAKCTESRCDADDLGADKDAQGGVFQADARIGSESMLDFAGSIRLGQPAVMGATLENPIGAEIHYAVAPHGKAMSGTDLWRQLNGPIGNPALWWTAVFSA